MDKFYYVAVERLDKAGKCISRSFVNDRAFGCIYSFTTDVIGAKQFPSIKSAKAYMKNFIPATREKVIYEMMYTQV